MSASVQVRRRRINVEILQRNRILMCVQSDRDASTGGRGSSGDSGGEACRGAGKVESRGPDADADWRLRRGHHRHGS